MRITKKQDRMPGIILTILLFVAEIAFTVLLLYTNLLSAKYIGIVFAVLLVLLLIDHLLIRNSVNRFVSDWNHIDGYHSCHSWNCKFLYL
mgnify:CR=1 FL=1